MQNMDFFHCANIMKSIGLPFVSSTKESNFMLVTHSYFTETYFPHAFLIFWEFCLRRLLDVRKPLPDISDNPCDKEANILHHLHLVSGGRHTTVSTLRTPAPALARVSSCSRTRMASASPERQTIAEHFG